MASKGSSILDVARRAGVSASTVSKAFNNRADISEPVRQKIMAIAAELHYVPNALIRSLRDGRTNTIGLYTWETLADPFLSVLPQLSRGFTAGIKELGCDTLNYSHLPTRTPDRMAATILDGRVDGVIINSGDIDYANLTALAEAGFPTVVLYTRDVPDGIGYIAIDNVTGIEAAVDRLVELGHTRIAFYASMLTPDFIERAAAYRNSLDRHGIPLVPELCITADNVRPSPAEACDLLLALDAPPTAVVVGNDADAYRMMERFRARGIDVPEDISMVGFDGIALEYAIPLSSVRQPLFQVAKTAALMVGEMLKGATAEKCRPILPVEFVASGSIGPVNG